MMKMIAKASALRKNFFGLGEARRVHCLFVNRLMPSCGANCWKCWQNFPRCFLYLELDLPVLCRGLGTKTAGLSWSVCDEFQPARTM